MRLLARLSSVAVLLVLLGGIALWGLDLFFAERLPQPPSLAGYRATVSQATRVLAADGSVIGEFRIQRRSVVDTTTLPPHVRHAAVAAEDHAFYRHDGLDWTAIGRATLVNLSEGRVSQGGSTITQQVARALYLTQDKTLARKLAEAFLARKLERALTKAEILDIYLNEIYFGHGRYGIEEAARFFFAKSAAGLSVAEVALLMSVVPSPNNFSPHSDPDGALRRRNKIISAMVDLGYVDHAVGAAGLDTPLGLAPPPLEDFGASRWFVDVVRRRVEEAVGRDALMEGGLTIHTTLSPAAQRAAHAAVEAGLESRQDAAEAALVLLDPRTREVLALVGGRDGTGSVFNRAIQARRQAGSTFKPFLYGAGLAAKTLTPQTAYPNRQVSYRGARGAWRPKNADGRHDGKQTTIHDALVRSLNVVAVQALRDVGLARLTEFARRVGIRASIPANLTAALGSAEVTPLELANAYATIASGGLAGQPVFVRRVEDRAGRLLYAEQARPTRAISPTVASQLTKMLDASVRTGTGRLARIPGHSVAGKTGTTSGSRDAWFAGFTKDIVGVVWVGRDRREPMDGASGGSLAAPIWQQAVSAVLGGGPSLPPRPVSSP